MSRRQERKLWREKLDAAYREQRRLLDAGEQNFWMDPPLHLIDDDRARGVLAFMGVEIEKHDA